jgi:hypothetical protein
MDVCQVDGCKQAVSKAGYAFCLEHWKAQRSGTVTRCATCQRWHERGAPAKASPRCRACEPPPAAAGAGAGGSEDDAAENGPAGGMLSSTRIGKHFGLSSVKTNLILAELGWIEKYVKGWVPTDRGNALGANVREMRNGTPFVVWPESILANAALRDSVAEQSVGVDRSPAPVPREGGPSPDKAGEGPANKSADFRAKFPATLRTQDGHMVRSRAEVLIDNWLYMQGLVHAYERRLPIEEECYCDFYLPGGKGVYIEFWGRESDPKYRERKAVKQAIYAKHGLRLIELGDAEIERLDDVLPRMLLKFGIETV